MDLSTRTVAPRSVPPQSVLRSKKLEDFLQAAIKDLGRYLEGVGGKDAFDTAPLAAMKGPTPSGAPDGANLGGFRSNQFDPLIREMAAKYGVPARLIKSVIDQESKFKPNARSGVGARGLMQLMPATARELGVRNPNDPRQSIEGGTKYLARLLKQFKGNTRFALAGYNAGPGNVRKYGGVPPFRETQTYVRNIMANYNR